MDNVDSCISFIDLYEGEVALIGKFKRKEYGLRFRFDGKEFDEELLKKSLNALAKCAYTRICSLYSKKPEWKALRNRLRKRESIR
jgi:hypothetical protein